MTQHFCRNLQPRPLEPCRRIRPHALAKLKTLLQVTLTVLVNQKMSRGMPKEIPREGARAQRNLFLGVDAEVQGDSLGDATGASETNGGRSL